MHPTQQAKLAFREVRIERKYHPHLIGRNGQTIRKIRNDTGANISVRYVPPPPPPRPQDF